MLRLTDHLPGSVSVDAIYVPGLCLTYDKQRLTSLNKACMEKAIQQMQIFSVKHLIFSGCYDSEVLKRELSLRRELARVGGVGSVEEISGIVNTDDELAKLALTLNTLDARSVLLVSDEYHMPRLVRWAKLRLTTSVEIFHISVRPPAYEFAWEPSMIKVIRSGIKPLWILWNVLLYIATPLLLHE